MTKGGGVVVRKGFCRRCYSMLLLFRLFVKALMNERLSNANERLCGGWEEKQRRGPGEEN